MLLLRIYPAHGDRSRNGYFYAERLRHFTHVESTNHFALEAWERMTMGGVKVVGCNGQQFERGHAIRLRWTSALNYTFSVDRRRRRAA